MFNQSQSNQKLETLVEQDNTFSPNFQPKNKISAKMEQDINNALNLPKHHINHYIADDHTDDSNLPSSSFKALLPDTPGEMLCFDRSEFVRLDFCVDEFVAECRKRVQLEQLRTDLEKYFKRLKGAMIDLINKDYHEFVSLSAHLADLDKQLATLRNPIKSIENDTSESRDALDVELGSLTKLLKSRNEEATRARLIHNAIGVIEGLSAAENYFNKFKDNTDNAKLLETAVDQYNITKHRADLTKNFPTTIDSLARLENLENDLVWTTEKELLATLSLANCQSKSLISSGQNPNNIDNDIIQKIQLLLSSGMLMNAIEKIEKSVQHKLIHPAVKRTIQNFKASGKFLTLKHSELESFFNNLLNLINEPCGLLIEISTGRHEKVSGVAGYDFVVRSIWPEIVDQIQSNFPHLFMLTNLEDFHERYMLAQTFVKKFELSSASQTSVKRLRTSAKMISFNSSWPLNQYFKKIERQIGDNYVNQLKLNTRCDIVGNFINKLYSKNVFVEKLAPKFWNLSIKFILKYIQKVYSTSHEQNLPALPSEDKNLNMSDSVMFDSDSSTLGCNVGSKQQGLIIELINLKSNLPNIVSGFFNETTSSKDLTLMKSKTISSISSKIEQNLEQMLTIFESTVAQSSLEELSKIRGIPRLFRNTNREAPTSSTNFMIQSFSFLEQIRLPLEDYCKVYKIEEGNRILFSEELSNKLNEDILKRVTAFVCRQTVGKYKDIVTDLLGAVKKLEDSLLKLKKIRRNKAKQTAQQSSRQSDDDKIRLQLKLDIEYYIEKFRSYGITKTEYNITDLEELDNIAVNIKTSLNNKNISVG